VELSAIAGSQSLSFGLVTRAKIVLMSAEGLSNRDIAAKIDYSTQSVALWWRRYRERGIAGLHDELRPGRPRTIVDEQVAELIQKTLQSKPRGRIHCSVRSLAKETALSAPTVQRILKAFGLQPPIPSWPKPKDYVNTFPRNNTGFTSFQRVGASLYST